LCFPLALGLTLEMVKEMAGYAPGQIVLAENSLADDTAMPNAYYILRDRNIELKLV
jgi:adenine-specific DNA-methyltransferase